MKTISGIIAASIIGFAVAQGALAQSQGAQGRAERARSTPPGEASADQPSTPSTRTRAEVQKECLEALRANRTPSGECSPEPAATTRSTRTRAEVQAECVQALKENRTPSGECSPEPQMKR